jgi:hypothetical protein
LQDELDTFVDDTDRTERFINIVNKYTTLDELTPAVIMEFIDKIVVHEADRSTGERKQKVDVHLSFIGKYETESPEITPEQIVAEETARLKRQRCREAQRRYMAKKKAMAQLELEENNNGREVIKEVKLVVV